LLGEGDHPQDGGGVASPAATILPPPLKHRAFETIADHAHRYRTQYLVHHSPGHQRTAAYNLVRAEAMFGDFLPSDIQPHHIAAWTDALRGRGIYTEQGRQVSDTTAHNYLRTFRALLAWIKNPHEKFGQPKGRHQIWEVDDRAAFTAAAFDLGLPNMAFALKLAFYTGQRTADLLKFTEHQLVEMKFLLDKDVKAVLADKNGKVWGWQFTQGKGGVPMHIPFEPDLLAELRKVIATNRARDRCPKADGSPKRLLTHVLVNDATGKPWLYRDFNRTWNRIKDHAIKETGRAHMDELHWHDFRRSRVVELKRQGSTHDQIAQLTGHEPGSVDGIMKVYGPVDSNMTARVIATSHTASKAKRNG
jgi:integrase